MPDILTMEGLEVPEPERKKRFADYLRDLQRQQVVSAANIGSMVLTPVDGEAPAAQQMAGGAPPGPLGKVARFVSQTATASAPDPNTPLTPEEQAELLALLEEKEAGRIQPAPGDDGGGVALGRGAAQGATLGFGDELEGLVQAAGQKLLPESLGGGGEQARGRGFLDLYRESRDAARAENDRSSDQHPWLYGGGQVAGSIPITIATAGRGKGVAQGLTAAQRIATGVKTGAKLGALLGLSEGRADLTKGEVGRSALEVGVGGLGGGVFGGALSSLGEVGKAWLSPKLEKYALERGRKLLTSGADQLSSRKELSDDAVRAAFREGAIGPLGSAKKASSKLDAVREQLGAAYAGLLDDLEKRGVPGPNARRLADDLLERGAQAELNQADPALAREFLARASDIVEKSALGESAGVAQTGRLGLNQAETYRRGLDRMAKYGRVEETPLNEVRRDIAGVVRRANEDAIEAAGMAAAPGSDVAELASQFKPLKQRLGPLIEASNAARRGAAREAQRTGGGVGKAIQGGAEMMALGVPGYAGKVALGGLGRAVTSSEAAAAKALAEILAGGSSGGAQRALTPKETDLLLELTEGRR